MSRINQVGESEEVGVDGSNKICNLLVRIYDVPLSLSHRIDSQFRNEMITQRIKRDEI
jgi:hypothetical protein